jgi:hypothetical protein
MKVKLLALAFVVTVLALVSQPAAKASVFCPAYTCYQAIQNCVTSGGGPAEASTSETCYTLPTHAEYTIYIITCYHEESTTTYQECYR